MESIYHKILDLKEYFRLYDEADALADPQEQKHRIRLLDAISEAITDYDVHVREYAYRIHGKAVSDRGLRITPISDGDAKARWDALFAAGFSDAELEEIYFDQYRWHLFSYEKRPCLRGQEARLAFDAAEKSCVLVFFQHTDRAFRIENAGLIRAEDFDVDVPSPYTDVYLFDPAGRWCYIHTHEAECGPYFLKA